MSNVDNLRFPIGKFSPQENYSEEEIRTHIHRIETLPAKVEAIAKSLTSEQMKTPYREGGWTARQVIHHLADSHSNAYIRIKWTITENTPLIKAYNEKDWAETPEVEIDPMVSIDLLKPLHIKITALLKHLKPTDLQKSFLHPETNKHVRLDRMIALYAWHGEHHLGHLQIISKM